MDIPPDRQKWFEHLCRFSTPEATVHEHRDRSGTHRVEIFRGVTPEGTLAATIGLMDVEQRAPGAAAGARTELLMDSTGDDPKIADVLALIALQALASKALLAPGVIFERAVSAYFPGHALPHAFLVPPFQWEKGMTEVTLATHAVYPLVAVPISQAERDYVTAHPPRALERIWQAQGAHVLDWSRASAV